MNRMNIVLWVLQVLLAAYFALAGYTKALSSMADIHAQMAWAVDVPDWVPRLAGWSEVLAVLGLILPGAFRILPFLVPLAAAGLAVVMALASLFHIARGEFFALPVTVVPLLVAAFVAYARFKLHPIPPRG